MAKPDRALIPEMLEAAAEEFPNGIDPRRFNDEHGLEVVTATIGYMESHGLLKTIPRKRMGTIDSYAEITITHEGIDYISDDGGLTAELGVVTVRLEAETIHTLIMAQIECTDAPRHEKNLLRRQLEALPEEGLRHLTSQLIRQGLEAAPDAIRLLRTLIGP